MAHQRMVGWSRTRATFQARWLAGLVGACTLGAVTCGGDPRGTGIALQPGAGAAGGQSGAAAPPAFPPPASEQACASAPTGDWDGEASIALSGAGSAFKVRAQMHWAWVETLNCVDHYQPVGTVSYAFSGNCHLTIEPSAAPIGPYDGELLIDRTTSPPGYRMTGASNWAAVQGCEGDTPEPTQVGGEWANDAGSFDGAVISGHVQNVPEVIDWRLMRTGATFPPPDAGCAQATTERWSGTASVSFAAAVSVTWTRVSTVGCVDYFRPSGTASQPATYLPCASLIYDPSTHPVVPYDGLLTIDRSSNPGTFNIEGVNVWKGTETCTRDDGTVLTYPGPVGGEWGLFSGAFDGNQWSGGAIGEAPKAYAWSLSRLP